MATPIPTNRAPFTVGQVAAATGGTVLREGEPLHGVSTDTRTLESGALFVALTGESFDGHRFLGAATEKGAAGFVVSDASAAPAAGGVVLVPDTRKALGRLGWFHRERWGVSPGERTLVAIGGSAGKTTTTRAVAALLGVMRPGEVHATVGNLNNDVGLPMTLLGLEERHRLAVVEVGTSRRGEVADLARVALPNVAVVTLVAPEHTEGIGTLDDVANEEGDLFAALPRDGVAVGNADDARVVWQMQRSRARRRVMYGRVDGCDVKLLGRTVLGVSGSRIRVALGKRVATFETPLLGEAGVSAALAALAVAESVLGPVPEGALEAALARVAGVRDGRLVPVELADGTVVLDDCYNSNSGSLAASLRTAREVADSLGRRLGLVLGEMREMGELAVQEHEAMARAAVASRPAWLVAVNGEAERFARAAEAAGIGAEFVATSDEAAPRVTARVRPGDVVLVKGSRGVALEKVVAALASVPARG